MMFASDISPNPNIHNILALNANCTIQYKYTTNYVPDPDTGNYTPGDEILVIAKATAKPFNRPLTNFLAGIDEKSIIYKAYIVDPKKPEGIVNGTLGTVEFYKDQQFLGNYRQGKIRIYLPTQNPFVQGDLGTFCWLELLED